MLSHAFIYGFLSVCFAGYLISNWPQTTPYIFITAFIWSFVQMIIEINKPEKYRDENNDF